MIPAALSGPADSAGPDQALLDRYTHMALRCIPWHEVDADQWDAAAYASSESWLWHTSSYQRTLSTWRQRTDVGFAVADGSDLIGVVPLHLVSDRLARWIPSPFLDSFGGPVLDDRLSRRERRSAIEATTAELLATAGKWRAVWIDLVAPALAAARFRPGDPAVNPFVELGAAARPTQTWVLDVGIGAEALWDGLDGRTRTAVRKAEKEGVVVREAGGEEDLHRYYDLHERTYHRTGVTPHPVDYFRGIWQSFVATGKARVWFAELGGQTIGAQVFAVHDRGSLYWTGASSEEALRVGANNLVQWTAIRHFAGDGIEHHEIGEAFPGARGGKAKGLNDFKSGFGGRLRPLHRGRLVRPPGLLPIGYLLRSLAELRGGLS